MFKSVSTPTDLRLQSVSGERLTPPICSTEKYDGPPLAALLRERIPDREVSQPFAPPLARSRMPYPGCCCCSCDTQPFHRLAHCSCPL